MERFYVQNFRSFGSSFQALSCKRPDGRTYRPIQECTYFLSTQKAFSHLCKQIYCPGITPRRILRDKKRASAGPKGQFLSALKDGFFRSLGKNTTYSEGTGLSGTVKMIKRKGLRNGDGIERDTVQKAIEADGGGKARKGKLRVEECRERDGK